MVGVAMSPRWPSRSKPEPEPRYVGSLEDKLSHIEPMSHDPDERPSREDKAYGETIFNRAPVPIPRFLLPKRARPPRRRP